MGVKSKSAISVAYECQGRFMLLLTVSDALSLRHKAHVYLLTWKLVTSSS